MCTSDGNLYVWGRNNYAQMASVGASKYLSTPFLVPAPWKMIDCACGDGFTAAVACMLCAFLCPGRCSCWTLQSDGIWQHFLVKHRRVQVAGMSPTVVQPSMPGIHVCVSAVVQSSLFVVIREGRSMGRYAMRDSLTSPGRHSDFYSI